MTTQNLGDISKILFKNVKVYEYSDVLVEDTLLVKKFSSNNFKALKNFTSKEANLDSIDDPKLYDPVLEIFRNKMKTRYLIRQD